MLKNAATKKVTSQKFLIHRAEPVRSMAFIHCVGSRQQEGVNRPQADGKVNEYCSRVCCSSALHAVNEVHARFPGTRVYDVYRDIRTYARFTEERLYEQAAKSGTTFFRYTEEQLPRVEGNSVVVKDVLTWNQELEFEADLVVLVTGMVPNPIPNIISSLKLPVGSDRFLSEAHPKLRPVEVANNGIYLAGTCQAPMDITEVSAGAAAASSKAAILLGEDSIALDPYVAFVREAKCDGCGLCVPECSYTGAIFVDGDKKAHINSALCKGCGACVAVCPHRALDLNGWQLEQIEAMVDAFAEA
jgi:heterodisulfide reductase subunit A